MECGSRAPALQAPSHARRTGSISIAARSAAPILHVPLWKRGLGDFSAHERGSLLLRDGTHTVASMLLQQFHHEGPEGHEALCNGFCSWPFRAGRCLCVVGLAGSCAPRNGTAVASSLQSPPPGCAWFDTRTCECCNNSTFGIRNEFGR
jgi:hypothetical protein